MGLHNGGPLLNFLARDYVTTQVWMASTPRGANGEELQKRNPHCAAKQLPCSYRGESPRRAQMQQCVRRARFLLNFTVLLRGNGQNWNTFTIHGVTLLHTCLQRGITATNDTDQHICHATWDLPVHVCDENTKVLCLRFYIYSPVLSTFIIATRI